MAWELNRHTWPVDGEDATTSVGDGAAVLSRCPSYAATSITPALDEATGEVHDEFGKTKPVVTGIQPVVTGRRKIRKFKVSRAVLKERLRIFWIVVYKLRKLIILHFGYDPKMRNIDQSPFHGNEAGSAECNTLALKGAPTVPLVEDHAATRDRWSLNSVTYSCEERVRVASNSR